MDIAKVSMNLAEANTMRSFGIGILRQQMDLAEQVGEQLAEMMQAMQVPAAAQVSPEGTINIVV